MNEAERLTRALFDAFARNDVEAVSAMIAPDAAWRFPGRQGALAGVHAGREAIFGFLMKVASLTGGTFHAEAFEIVGGENVAYFRFRGRAERNGKTLDNDTCLRLQFEGGKLVDAQEWVWDLDHVEDFWR
jgi:ketosteroid isomerase-like protein